MDMVEHEKRFKEGGLYAKMRKYIKEWVILDFREEKKKVKYLRPNFWHILYPDDFSYLIIQKRNGYDEKKINLLESITSTPQKR